MKHVMNENLARILASIPPPTDGGSGSRAGPNMQLDDGRVLEVRNGRTYVTNPQSDPVHAFGPHHDRAVAPTPALLRELGATERTGWSHGKLIMLSGRSSSMVAAGLGKLAARWGHRHGPVRWVAADSAPHDWKDLEHKDRPAVWSLPKCGTLIIGKVWPMLSQVQLDYVLRACQDRRHTTVILAAELPDQLGERQRMLSDYVLRDGVVVLTDKVSASGRPAPARPPFGEPDR